MSTTTDVPVTGSRQKARANLADEGWMFTQIEAGRTPTSIARELGVTRATVESWMRVHGLVARNV